jgi:hypothetical protein
MIVGLRREEEGGKDFQERIVRSRTGMEARMTTESLPGFAAMLDRLRSAGIAVHGASGEPRAEAGFQLRLGFRLERSSPYFMDRPGKVGM